MSRFTPSSTALCVGSVVLALAACSPTFNWREVRPDNSSLSFLLPCKPDKAEKVVPLGGQATTLRMFGCETGGVTFAVSMADIGNAANAQAVLSQWQDLTLANMKAGPVGTNAGASQVSVLKVPGVAPEQPAVRVRAAGQRTDAKPVEGEAVYFSQGSYVFQAVIYATHVNPDVTETFFSSLSLR